MALQAVYDVACSSSGVGSVKIDPSLSLDDITIQDINTLLEKQGKNECLNILRTALTVLEARPHLITDAASQEAASQTLSVITNLIIPTLDISQDGDRTDYQQIRREASTGIDLIHLIVSQDGIHLCTAASLMLASYSDASEKWSDEDLAESAQELLDSYFESNPTQLQHFILDDILQAFIRPLFSKSRPATVTASGRKAEFVQPSRYGNFDVDAESNKPWKYQQRHVVTVFSWAVDHVDRETLQKNWHQFTPVLLTLLDETDTPLKLKSLAIFKIFWAKCPSETMRQTGLAQVFEDAIFPAVLYLPSLTPEDESVRILTATYSALFAIAGIDSDQETSKPQSGPSGSGVVKFSDKQRRLVHKIVREGILTAYHHSGEYVTIAEVLCRQLRLVVNGMGLLAVKHLKDIVPLVSTIISDPFASAHPSSLIAALDALCAIQATCWPRIPYYANDIIKMLMLCWLSLEDADEEEKEASAARLTTKPRPSASASTKTKGRTGEAREKLIHNARILDAILQADAAGPTATPQDDDDQPKPATGDHTLSTVEEEEEEVADDPGMPGSALAARARPLFEKHASLKALFGPWG